jgi:hypothetical protein
MYHPAPCTLQPDRSYSRTSRSHARCSPDTRLPGPRKTPTFLYSFDSLNHCPAPTPPAWLPPSTRATTDRPAALLVFLVSGVAHRACPLLHHVPCCITSPAPPLAHALRPRRPRRRRAGRVAVQRRRQAGGWQTCGARNRFSRRAARQAGKTGERHQAEGMRASRGMGFWAENRKRAACPRGCVCVRVCVCVCVRARDAVQGHLCLSCSEEYLVCPPPPQSDPLYPLHVRNPRGGAALPPPPSLPQISRRGA